MKKPSLRFAINLTDQDREIIGKLSKRLDLNFRETIRQAIRNEYVRTEQMAMAVAVTKAMGNK